jgi:hypothetical protein
MKNYGLVLTTLATLFATGMTLHAAGWFGPRCAHARSSHPHHCPTVTAEAHTASVPAYYRQAGPRHWRDCLGQN